MMKKNPKAKVEAKKPKTRTAPARDELTQDQLDRVSGGAFRELPPEERKSIANNTVKVG